MEHERASLSVLVEMVEQHLDEDELKRAKATLTKLLKKRTGSRASSHVDTLNTESSISSTGVNRMNTEKPSRPTTARKIWPEHAADPTP